MARAKTQLKAAVLAAPAADDIGRQVRHTSPVSLCAIYAWSRPYPQASLSPCVQALSSPYLGPIYDYCKAYPQAFLSPYVSHLSLFVRVAVAVVFDG